MIGGVDDGKSQIEDGETKVTDETNLHTDAHLTEHNHNLTDCVRNRDHTVAEHVRTEVIGVLEGEDELSLGDILEWNLQIDLDGNAKSWAQSNRHAPHSVDESQS